MKNAQPKKDQAQSLQAATREFQRQYLFKLLQRTHDVKRAAAVLGIQPNSVFNLMARFGIKRTTKVTRTYEYKLLPPKSR